MSYTPITDFPNLRIFQWSRPEAPFPALAAPINGTTTTITVTAPPLDRDGSVITGNFLMGIRDLNTGYVENVYVPAAGVSANGLTLSGCIRRIRLEGLDYTTSSTELEATGFNQDSPVFCAVSPVLFYAICQSLIGQIGDTYKLNSPPTYTGVGIHQERVFTNAAARDAAITVPVNGMSCYLTTEGYYTDYQGGSWQQRANGATPNASTTVAGKVEAAVQSENDAGTTTGGTGALLFAGPNVNAATVQKGIWVYAADAGATDAYAITIVPAPAALVEGMSFYFKANTANTGAATLNVNGLGAKTIKKYHNEDLQDNDIEAGGIYLVSYRATEDVWQLHTGVGVNMSEANTFFGATDITGAEAESLTNDSILSNLHFHKKNVVVATGSGASSQNVAHGLGVTPKKVMINAVLAGSGVLNARSSGVYDAINSKCVFNRVYNSGGSDTAEAGSDSVNVINVRVGASAITATVTLDATNVAISWSTASNTGVYLLIESEV